MVDPDDLRIFLVVADELHFGRAAERLHMAQPPVSRKIRQLEKRLGAALFERSTRKVALTAVGEALIEPARAVLDALEQVEVVASLAGTEEIGRVRIAYGSAAYNALVGRLASTVKRTYPGIKLELLSQHFAQPAIQMLTRGDVDLAIGWWNFIPSGVTSRVIAVDELVVAMPETHRLAGRDSISFREVGTDPFVSLDVQTGSLLLDRLRELSINAIAAPPNVVQYAPNLWAVLSLVSADVGCTLTFGSVGKSIADPRLRFIRLEDKSPPVQLRMAWRDGSTDRALNAVLRLAETVLPTPPAD
ncbi:MAG: LysR substrate-binding domain-containing protein [Mycobacterium sp.]